MGVQLKAIHSALLRLAEEFGNDFTEEALFDPDSTDRVGLLQMDTLEKVISSAENSWGKYSEARVCVNVQEVVSDLQLVHRVGSARFYTRCSWEVGQTCSGKYCLGQNEITF